MKKVKTITLTTFEAGFILMDLHHGMRAIESCIRTGDVEFDNAIVNNVLTSIQTIKDKIEGAGEEL